MSANTAAFPHLNYRAGQPDKMKGETIAVPIPKSHHPLLQMFARAQRITQTQLVSQLVTLELERRFELASNMRLGELLARMAAGEKFTIDGGQVIAVRCGAIQ